MIKSWRVFIGIAMSGALAACSSDISTPVSVTADPLWSLGLQTHSAVLSTVAPHNTLQLTVAPASASGTSRADLGSPTFLTSDGSVRVSTNGLVTALQPTAQTYVIVSLTDPVTRITRVDSVRIRVTDVVAPEPLATFSIQPLPGDSTKIAASLGDMTLPLHVTATGANGTPLGDSLVVRYVSRKPLEVSVDAAQGIVTGIMPDSVVTIVATTTYYGVTKSDSVRVTVGYPLSYAIEPFAVGGTTASGSPRLGTSPDTIRLGVGAFVRFSGVNAGPYDLVFDDTTVGDIATLALPPREQLLNGACFNGQAHCFDFRTFSTPGTYAFHSPVAGFSGVFIIK